MTTQRRMRQSFGAFTPANLLLLIVLGLVLQAAHSADDGGGFEDTLCPDFRCSKGYAPVPKWPMSLRSKGCSGSGGGVNMYSMGGAGNDKKEYEHCCRQKDACYQICGSNKQRCDREMGKCIDDACSALSSEEKRKKCEDSKGMVTLMAQVGGCGEFDSFQRANCDCVGKAKAVEKRGRVLRSFYKKFNPNGIGKVEALAAKSAGKVATFAGLLRSLVAKYPAAIKKERDPNQEMMDRLMNDSKGDYDSPDSKKDNRDSKKDNRDSKKDSRDSKKDSHDSKNDNYLDENDDDEEEVEDLDAPGRGDEF